MKIKEITATLERMAPLSYQESYDNSGLIVGNQEADVESALLCIDTTPEVVEEAIKNGHKLIISHHPILLSGLKKLNGRNYVERTIISAIKNDVAIYAAHTNFDSVTGGVNSKICEKLGLVKCRTLSPITGSLKKLVTFIPAEHAEKVRLAVFDAGAGHIGKYDQCSYSTSGKGTFRASDEANPFVGEKNQLHFEEEQRFETIFPAHLEGKIISALKIVHPYEEVAYDIYCLDNHFDSVGAGMVGELENETDEMEFLLNLKNIFKVPVIRHTELRKRKIKKVAVCGGAGSFLLGKAIASGADIFVSGDFKYHQFFDAENRIIIADVGHYESEQYTKEIFYDILSKNFPNFALQFSKVNTNPVNYL